jgi:hypothetical protein
MELNRMVGAVRTDVGQAAAGVERALVLGSSSQRFKVRCLNRADRYMQGDPALF